jgi:hypothetical protein
MGRRSRPLWCRTRGRLAWTATAVSRDTGQPGRRGSQVAGEPVSWEPQRQPRQQPELATGMIGTAAPTTGRRATAGDRPQRNNRSQRNNRLDRNNWSQRKTWSQGKTWSNRYNRSDRTNCPDRKTRADRTLGRNATTGRKAGT